MVKVPPLHSLRYFIVQPLTSEVSNVYNNKLDLYDHGYIYDLRVHLDLNLSLLYPKDKKKQI